MNISAEIRTISVGKHPNVYSSSLGLATNALNVRNNNELYPNFLSLVLVSLRRGNYCKCTVSLRVFPPHYFIDPIYATTFEESD